MGWLPAGPRPQAQRNLLLRSQVALTVVCSCSWLSLSLLCRPGSSITTDSVASRNCCFIWHARGPPPTGPGGPRHRSPALPPAMNGGLPGFHNAPASRAVVVAAAIFSVTFGFRGRFLDLGLSYQIVYEKLKIWRLLTSLFAFSSTPELIFGAALLYYFRVFERQIGSNKYAVFIIFATMVSVLLQILALGYLKDPSLNPLTSGPYGLIFASYVPFLFDIPISMKFRIFGLSLSDKSFVYLAGLQLLFSSGRRSVIPGLSGILAGLLYRLNTFGIRRLKYPEFAISLFSRIPWPFPNNLYQRLPTTETDGSIPSHPVRPTESTLSATQDPAESSIATLVSMGFDRTSAMQALVLTNNDVNLASNILLEAQALQS